MMSQKLESLHVPSVGKNGKNGNLGSGVSGKTVKGYYHFKKFDPT